MRLRISYDNPQHRFIRTIVVTVTADGVPATQRPESKAGALLFDVPDGALALTVGAVITPTPSQPPVLNVKQAYSKATLASGAVVWVPTAPIDRHIIVTGWVGASKKRRGVFVLKLDLTFLDLTAYATLLHPPYTFAAAHGASFAVLECTDNYPGRGSNGAVTWACLIPPAVASAPSPTALGALLFLRPTASRDDGTDPYTNTDDVSNVTIRLTRYTTDPPAANPFYVDGTFFDPVPFCGWERQLVDSGKAVVLFWPFPHGINHGSVVSSRMPALVRSALYTLWIGGRLGSVGPLADYRLGLGGFSAGGARALATLRQAGNGAQVDELYLFEPADFSLRVADVESWYKLGGKVLRMMAGGYQQTAMIALAAKLADPVNATCKPAQSDYWYTSALYQAAISNRGGIEHFDLAGTTPAPGSPSAVSAVFLSSYDPSAPKLVLSWKDPATAVERVRPFTPGPRVPVPSHEEAASLVHWWLIGLYAGGNPIANAQTFMTVMQRVTSAAGESSWPVRGEADRIDSIRHEWTVIGGEGAIDRQAGFKGYFQICLENSGF
jgi:hypothetical protein